MKHLIYFFTLSLLVYSCNSDFDDIQSSKEDSDRPFLVFESTEDLQIEIDRLSQFSDQEILEREENEFQSMMGVYLQALEEEKSFFEELMADLNLESLTENELSDLSLKRAYFILDNAKYLHFFEDGGFTANTHRFEMAPVLTKEGLVQVGNHLYRFSYSNVEAIDLASNSIEGALKYFQTGNDTFISVKRTKVKTKIIASTGKHNARYTLDDCQGEADGLRIIGRAQVNDAPISSLGPIWTRSTLEVYAKRSAYIAFVYLYNTGPITITVDYTLYDRQNLVNIPASEIVGTRNAHQRTWTIDTQDWRVPETAWDFGPGDAFFEARNRGTVNNDLVDPFCRATWN